MRQTPTNAEIITIGTEILLGEILDGNAQYLAKQLRAMGVDLYRKTTVGDNAERIAQAINEALGRADVVLTTGGLGPTVDDATRLGVALAFNVTLEYHPELWEQVCARFQRFGRQPTENNRRQAYLPKGAKAMENPVGTAPAFLIEKGEKSLICLPGVPHEMRYIFEQQVGRYLRERFHLNSTILTRVLHTAGMGESQIDALINDLEQWQNPTVGLSAHPGQVDVRLTVKSTSHKEAVDLLTELENEIRLRLGDAIYGSEDDTLESVALAKLSAARLSLCVVEANLKGALLGRFAHEPAKPLETQAVQAQKAFPNPLSEEELLHQCRDFRDKSGTDMALGVSLHPGTEIQEAYIAIVREKDEKLSRFTYGGPPENASLWAANLALSLLRLNLEPLPVWNSSGSSIQTPLSHDDKQTG